MDGDWIDPLHEVPWVKHVLDQDEFYADNQGRRWTLDKIPPDTALQVLDELRCHSIHILHQYSDQMVLNVDSARRFGHEIPLEWEPDSAPYLDQFVLMQIEGVVTDADRAKSVALAAQWLDTKPMVQALQRRAWRLA